MSVSINASKTGIQASSPVILTQTAIPIGIPPGNGSTVGLKFTDTAGTFTLTTTIFPIAYPGGIWIWIPINGFTASTPSVAGLYWATTSTTSAGVCTGVTYASTGGAIPTAAQIAAAPAVTTTNYWLTQQTSAATVFSVTVPGGLMGANGSLRSEIFANYQNSATAKTTGLLLGGTAILTVAATTTIAGRYRNKISNRGAGTQIIAPATSAVAITDNAGAGVSFATIAVNTAVDVALTVTQTIAANTDFIIMEAITVEVFPG